MATKFKLSALALSLALAIPTLGFALTTAQPEVLDTIYVLSNGVTQNEVLTFQRDAKNGMVQIGRVATGGTGTGGGLGNQGALAFSKDGNYLFAVNPGSNSVSVFSVAKNGQLTLLDTADDAGLRPVSVTVDHNRVFVVNAGDGTIFGYKFNRSQGKLEPLPLTNKRLSGTSVGPAQISFDNEGEVLVVTEKATNKITTFAIDEESNTPADGVSINSSAATPFGFYFGKRNQLIVSEAHGGAPNASTLSSYKLKESGALELISASVPDNQTAACWVVTTPNGRTAFTTNTGSSSISSYAVKADGTLSLLISVAAQAAGATDIDVSNDGKVLYSLNAGSRSIGVYGIGNNGTLSNITSISALPAGATGLVVR